ncbi:MAG TPA: DUF5665 domain-containing protein [Candidatus Saccharimonadales bacterium]|nr:DUF5665 domain-containing protein [Candidatus Saccharimonadales bacterium]
MSKSRPTNNPKIDAAHLAEILMKAEYLDRKAFYLHSFLRGMVIGAGGVLGATVLIAVLLWILSLFDTIPFVGPVIDSARETIKDN